jgi:predicted GH43/DUF377 family glycosyl hydrolase
MTGYIEFCCGLAVKDDNVLVSFGYEDNAAYLLKVPLNYFKTLAGI